MPRDYRKEYDDYHGSPEQIKRRAARNKARKLMERVHGKKKLRGKDVDHKDFNPENSARSNLRIMPRSANRARQP
jgi:hypothetical protein